MLQIRTVIAHTSGHFDDEVNGAMTEGWELVRRECFITGADRATTFYAELERVVDDLASEDTTPDVAVWMKSRDPHYPYRCSACGCKIPEPVVNCPNCDRLMEMEE